LNLRLLIYIPIGGVMFVKKSKKIVLMHIITVFLPIYLGAVEYPTISNDSILSIDNAIKAAQVGDPSVKGNIHKQRAIQSLSIAASTMADPKISLSFANLPANSFELEQEGMTQAKIGISQVFPRGDTLDIKSQQLKTKSEAFPYQRIDRAAKVAVTVGALWLDAYRVQQSIALIEKNKSLFEQIVDVTMANYSSTLGKIRQQDVLQAQLELVRLDDRLEQLEQEKNRFKGMLTQWITTISLSEIQFSSQLPQIDLRNPAIIYNENWLQIDELAPYLSNHPAVIAIEKQVNATETEITLAKQKFKPEWGVNASYGYRSDDSMGNSRADLFSVGLTFDLPLFTHNRQDQNLNAAIYQTEAAKTEKTLVLRQLFAAFSSAKGRLLSLKKRQKLYKFTLLPQLKEQAEAYLTAYTNDEGSFSEVIRVRIDVLNTEINELALNVEEQKIRLELNYLFVDSVNEDYSQIKTDLNNVNFSYVNSNISTEKSDLLGEK